MNRDKVLIGINYLLYILYNRILNEDDIKSVAAMKTAELIDKFLEPWMRSHQGWKGLINETSKETIKTKEKVEKAKVTFKDKEQIFKKSNMNSKMPLMLILAMILMSLVSRSDGIQAYDCSKPHMGKIYSLMDLE